MSYTAKLVNIRDIKPGDTIEHNGKLMTVCNSDIKNCKFMGLTVFGDSYRLGNKPIVKVQIN